MARTVEQVLIQQVAELSYANARLIAEVEAARDEIATLKAAKADAEASETVN